MTELKWIKLWTDTFDNRKIKLISRMPKGDTILVIWFRLLIMAGNINDSGKIYITPEIPYSIPELCEEMGKTPTAMAAALTTLIRYGMIEKDPVRGYIQIKNWEEYQQQEAADVAREKTRLRVEKFRNKNVTSNAV